MGDMQLPEGVIVSEMKLFNQGELARMRRGVEAMRQAFDRVAREMAERAETLRNTRVDAERLMRASISEYNERMRQFNSREDGCE